MPIRPQNRFFYPIDWVQLSEAIRFGRAKGCCEQCGRPHGQLVCRAVTKPSTGASASC